jgi:hypothetical protein
VVNNCVGALLLSGEETSLKKKLLSSSETVYLTATRNFPYTDKKFQLDLRNVPSKWDAIDQHRPSDIEYRPTVPQASCCTICAQIGVVSADISLLWMHCLR